ncbi:ubiquitin carboxyl-terminal hydrolase [Botrytis cinerea]
METKILKMYKTPLFPSFDSSNTPAYNYTGAFKYNPRSLLMKNPRQNRLILFYFELEIIGFSTTINQIFYLSSRSKIQFSFKSVCFTPRKISASPPPIKAAETTAHVKKVDPPSPEAFASVPCSITSVFPRENPFSPSFLSRNPDYIATSSVSSLPVMGSQITHLSFVSSTSSKLPPSPPPSSAVSASARSPLPSSSSPAINEIPLPSPPTSAVSAPSEPAVSLLNKPRPDDKNEITTKLDPLKEAPSEAKKNHITIKSVDPLKSYSVAKDEKIVAKSGVPKRLRSDDENEGTAARSESLKKRRIAKASKVATEKATTSKPASKVRNDSSRMPSNAQRGCPTLLDMRATEIARYPKEIVWPVLLAFSLQRYHANSEKLEVQCKRLGWYPGPSGQGDPHEQITWMLEKIEKQIKASSVATELNAITVTNVSVGDLQDELALSIPLKPRIRNGSVSSYLHKYLDETIEGYKCEKCKVTGDVHRVQSISHAPDILFVQLKRFGYDGRKDKLAIPIDHTLDLSPYRDPSGSKDSMEYELVASVSHSGSLDYGHYTCDARGPDGRWSCFNDAHYNATTLAKALGVTNRICCSTNANRLNCRSEVVC